MTSTDIIGQIYKVASGHSVDSRIRDPKWIQWIFRFVGVLAVGLLLLDLYLLLRLVPMPDFVTTERVFSAVGSLVGTLIGAWLAFLFAARIRRLTRDDENAAAGNMALFALSSFWNQTKQYQKEISGPYRNRKDAWLNLPASLPLSENFKLQLNNLSFIANFEPNVFQSLLLEETRFDLVAFSIKHHRDLVLNKVWPVMAKKLEMGEQIAEDEVKKLIGPALLKDLTVTTGAIINNVDENVTSHEMAFKTLRVALKRLYPKRKFIDFSFPTN